VISEGEAKKLLCHPTEMMAEDEANKTKETYFLVIHNERKLSTGNDQGVQLIRFSLIKTNYQRIIRVGKTFYCTEKHFRFFSLF
jgi:hypothetical protein